MAYIRVIAIVDVTWGTATMRVLAPSADLDWLAEFLAPSVQVTRPSASAGRPPFHTVELVPVETPPPVPSITTTRTLFVRDGGNVEVRCGLEERGGWNAFHDDGVICVSADSSRTTITTWSGRAARHLMLLTVRELLMTELLRARAGIVLHAAAVTFDGMTMVVCGPKAAGKTTFACRIAGAGGALVANDRVALGVAPRFDVRAVPTVITVRRDAAELLGLRIPWPPAGWQTLRRLSELGPDAPPWADEPANPDYRWTMSPPQFARVLGRDFAFGDGEPVFVFPDLDLDDTRSPTRRLEPDEVARRLRDQLLGRPGARVSEVFAPADQLHPDAVEAFLEQVIAGAARLVPGYQLRLGSDWHETAVDDLLAPLRGDPVASA